MWMIGLLVLVSFLGLPQMGSGQSVSPADAVFQLVVYDHEPDADGNFRGQGYGTAFFIATDGTALTVSHVVTDVVRDPAKYRLVAVLDKEFYDATIVCASKLPGGSVVQTKDVAKIKLAPSTAFEGRKDMLYLRPKNGPQLDWAKAHTGPLPQFPALAIGDRASGHVRVIGFGIISALPLKWTTEGRVERTWAGRDGTPVFDIEYRNPARPGNSGSPVLNDANEVVGLWTWYYKDEPTKGIAQASTVLAHPC